MDIIRVNGNHAVHPGTINLVDDPGKSAVLFTFLNLIVNHFFTTARMVNEAYESLPERDVNAIKTNDS